MCILSKWRIIFDYYHAIINYYNQLLKMFFAKILRALVYC